jgi:hypothetical protein
MSLPSNGIIAEDVREMMPPYQLSDDLLQATFAALAPPPCNASTAWRHPQIARLTQEISTLMSANAAQARQAADILMVPEMAKTIAARVHAPELTAPEMLPGGPRRGRVGAHGDGAGACAGAEPAAAGADHRDGAGGRGRCRGTRFDVGQRSSGFGRGRACATAGHAGGCHRS